LKKCNKNGQKCPKTHKLYKKQKKKTKTQNKKKCCV